MARTKRIRVEQIASEHGVTAADVVSGSSVLLVPKGYELSSLRRSQPDIVDFLKRHGVHHIVVKESPIVTAEEFRNLLKSWNHTIPQVNTLLSQVVVRQVAGLFSNIHDKGRREHGILSLLTIGPYLQDEIHKTPQITFSISMIRGVEETLSHHSLNVALVSGYIASRMFPLWPKYTAAVAMGALLHDVGKAFLPRELIGRRKTFSEAEIRMLQCHTLLGEAVLKDVSVGDDRILSAIRSHHELWEGKGYPDGLKGEDIPIPARIVAIADMFDNLINEAGREDSRRSDEAVSAIVGRAQSNFDTFIVRTLLSGLGLYPAGTAVELSDGSFGVVLEAKERNLLSPRILILRDSAGRSESRMKIVDIAGQDAFFIRCAIDDFGKRELLPLQLPVRFAKEPHVFRKYRSPVPMTETAAQDA